MLSKYSVRRPMTVFVAVILVLILGVVSYLGMQTDLLPSIDLPYIAVITTYPGASPEKIEQTVTKPLEQSLATVGGVETVSSVSSENSSMVIFQFTYGTNMDSAMIEMNNQIDLVRSAFDDAVGSPILMKINPDILPVMVASVDVDGMDIETVSRFASETVIPAFERISGVASVSGMGLVEEHLTVTLNQEKIDALNKRVLKSVNGQMDDAEAMINRGLGQVASQRDQITREIVSQSQKLDQAETALNQGKDQASLGLGAAGAERMVLESAVKEAKTGRDKLKKVAADKAQLPVLEAKIESANSGAQKLGEEISALEGENDALTTEIESYRAELGGLPEDEASQARREELNTLISAGEEKLSQNRETIAQKQNDKSGLQAEATSLTAEKTAIESSLAAAGNPSDEELNQAISGMDQAIGEAEARLRDVSGTEAEMKKAIAQLDSQLSTVKTGRIQLTVGLSQAYAGLTAGEQKLSESKGELASARDAAVKQADLSKLITQQTIAGILMGENFAMPAGYLSEDGEKYAVKVGEQFSSVEELENLELFTVSAGDIGTIRLKDVADIAFTVDNGGVYAKINGNDGILLTMQKQSTFSTSEVSEDIREVMEQLENENPGLHMTALSDQGVYIDLVTGSVIQNLAMGGALAILILFLFLHNFRPTFVVAVSIPISLLLAVVLMYFTGVTLNSISLAGLALGVGMLVDNSIVVVENIYRLRQEGVSVARAAVQGAKEVSGAIAASTLTTICVFLPIVFTDGISKELFTDMGLTIGYSLLASLLVALTVVPAFSATILKKPDMSKHDLFDGVVGRYAKLLGRVLDRKGVFMGVVVGLLLLAVFGVTQMGTAFIPETNGQQISVSVEMPVDATTEEIHAYSDEICERIMALPGIETVGAMQGGGGVMSMGGGLSMYVRLLDEREYTSGEIAQMVEQATADLPCTVTASGSMMDMSALGGSGIQVNITGDDLEQLQKTAGEIAEVLRKVPGMGEVSDGMEDSASQVKITVDKNKAMAYGLTVAQVYQQITSGITAETTATTVTLNAKDYSVIVARDEKSLPSRKTLMDYELTGTKDGKEATVKLSDVATVEQGRELSSISHRDNNRTMTVSADIAPGYNIGKVGAAVDGALKDYPVPAGCTVALAGENETIQSSLRDLLFMIGLAVVMIYLIMVAQFQSLLSPFIVMFTLPLAFTGGLLALWICGMEVSIISMLGFLVLSGVIVNNGIVFVDCVNRLRLDGMERREALIETGRIRIRPILMTALTTILGLCTLALGIGMGADMLQPMAVVIVGGLTYATLLTLFVVPVMYDVFQKRAPRDIDRELDGL